MITTDGMRRSAGRALFAARRARATVAAPAVHALDRLVKAYPRGVAVYGPNAGTLEFFATTQAKTVAEVGTYRGHTTRGIARLLPADGCLHLFDFASRLEQVGRVLREDGFTNVVMHGSSDRWLDSYNWPLMSLLEQHPEPLFDYVFLDGAHTWNVDGFAFLLLDRLLKPGGHVDFDDYEWTIAGSETLRPSAFAPTRLMYTEEQIHTPQVHKIIDLLVRRDDRYEEVVTNKVFKKTV